MFTSSVLLVGKLEDIKSVSVFIFFNFNHFSKRCLSRRKVDGGLFFFPVFKTTIGSTITEFSAHSASSKQLPRSQALLLLGHVTEAGSLDGSFEISVLDLFVQHTCRLIVPSVSVNRKV